MLDKYSIFGMLFNTRQFVASYNKDPFDESYWTYLRYALRLEYVIDHFPFLDIADIDRSVHAQFYNTHIQRADPGAICSTLFVAAKSKLPYLKRFYDKTMAQINMPALIVDATSARIQHFEEALREYKERLNMTWIFTGSFSALPNMQLYCKMYHISLVEAYEKARYIYPSKNLPEMVGNAKICQLFSEKLVECIDDDNVRSVANEVLNYIFIQKPRNIVLSGKMTKKGEVA